MALNNSQLECFGNDLPVGITPTLAKVRHFKSGSADYCSSALRLLSHAAAVPFLIVVRAS